MVYVDDFIVIAPESRIKELSALVQLLLAAIGCPMSWHKTCLGGCVDYLGFCLDVRNATVGIPAKKYEGANAFLSSLVQGQYVSFKSIQKGRGRLLWMTWMSPVLRPWLAPFFQCGEHVCRGNRVRVSAQLATAANFWKSVLGNYSSLHRCVVAANVGSLGAADACARGNTACLGGWWNDSSTAGTAGIRWFRLQLEMADLPNWMRPQVSAQQRIAFWELLAQVILAFLRFRELSGVHGTVCIGQSCDNAGAVSAMHKFFSTKAPMSFGLQALAWHAVQASAEVSVSFIPGKKNIWADKISRWHEYPDFIASLDASGEVTDFSIRDVLDPVWDFAAS